MKAEIAVMTAENIDRKAIARGGEILKNGGLVAFPTETVYGLGGNALDPKASMKIYAAKGRPSDNPLIVHIADIRDLDKIVTEVPEKARILAEKYWPGPLTMILPKADIVPKETTGGLDSVAVRFPSDPIAQELILAAGGYVAAPSANTSGRPSPTLGKYVYEDMNGKIEMLLDGGQVGIGVESTIVDVTGEKPMILRPGYVTYEMMQEILPELLQDPTMFSVSGNAKPKAPGMKYKHYAPKGELTIISGQADHVRKRLQQEVDKKRAQGYKVGVIAAGEDGSAYQADSVKVTGNRDDLAQIAKDLFRMLREFDDEGMDFMYTEGFSDKGIGQAVMNRLLKAAGHKIIDADQEETDDSNRQ